jgi:hypothetical protein
MENTSFRGLIAGPHCQDQPAVVGGILDTGGFAAIFAGLLYWHFMKANGQAMPHANPATLRPSITKEWDQLAA